jgi:hypothetical protein
MLLISRRKQQYQRSQTQNVKTTIVIKNKKLSTWRVIVVTKDKVTKLENKTKQNKHACSMDDKNHNNKTMKKTKDIEKPNLMWCP